MEGQTIQNTKNFIDIQFYALGTINYIKIYDCLDESVLQKAVDRVLEIEKHMSAFLPESDISRINENAGKNLVPIHEDTMLLLKRGTTISKLSSGAFDMTVHPLIELWGIGKKNNYIPSKKEIQSALKLVNYRDLILDNKHMSAAMRYPGQSVNLGGIAKGYAADEVKRILQEFNIDNAIINLGGNVLTMGNRPDGRLWQIGIQNPLAATGRYLGILSLTEKTIVTSGSNERFFIKDGIRYHHILDSRTGEPAQSSLLSVTVVCDCSMDADALTTALFVLGLEDGISLLKRLNSDALFVTDNLGLYLTEGIKDRFTPSNEG